MNDIAGAVTELLDVQVTVQRQKDDGQIEVVDRKIRDVLGAALPTEWTGVPDFVKKLSGVALEPASSPGIAITILGLAVDLADAEYRTAQVRIAMLKQRADILDALARNIAQSKRLLGMAREDFRAVTVGQPILTNLEELRKPATPPAAGDPRKSRR